MRYADPSAAAVRRVTANGDQAQLILARPRPARVGDVALQPRYPGLVGRVGDCLQLRAGVPAPDDLEPSRQILLEAEMFIGRRNSDKAGCLHGANHSIRTARNPANRRAAPPENIRSRASRPIPAGTCCAAQIDRPVEEHERPRGACPPCLRCDERRIDSTRNQSCELKTAEPCHPPGPRQYPPSSGAPAAACRMNGRRQNTARRRPRYGRRSADYRCRSQYPKRPGQLRCVPRQTTKAGDRPDAPDRAAYRKDEQSRRN